MDLLSTTSKVGKYIAPQIREMQIPRFVSSMTKELAPDSFKHTVRTATDGIVNKGLEFDAVRGTRIPLSEARMNNVLNTITSNPEEQALIKRLVESETTVVTPEVEKQVMMRQYRSFKEANPNITSEKIFIYSPMPKGQTKSYTSSGQAFARANGIPQTRITTSFRDTEIPKDAAIFMVDDCSITGASMVFDLLEKLPADFKGQIILTPTVKGIGNTAKGHPLAETVLQKLSEINTPSNDRAKLAEELKLWISDGKKQNKEMLDKLANPDNYKDVKISLSENCLQAPCYRETETFRNLPKEKQRLLDSLVTADGINTGYHDSGVMVLMPTKTPNNNIGVMEIIGDEMGLKTKPSGILTYRQNAELRKQGLKCGLTIVPNCNSNANTQTIAMEAYTQAGRIGSPKAMQYNASYNKETMTHTADTLDVVVRGKDGTEHVIKYQARPEMSETKDGVISYHGVGSSEEAFGFEAPETLLQKTMRFLKGQYVPKSTKKDISYRYDVLAIPRDAEVVSVGGKSISEIMQQQEVLKKLAN